MGKTIRVAGKKEKPAPQQEKVHQRDTWTFPVNVSGNRTVSITVHQGQEKVERKAKFIKGHRDFGGGVIVPVFGNLKGEDGQPVKTDVSVQGVRISVQFPDGTTLEGRSCCKPPDIFNVRTGKRRAIRRLFDIDSGIDPHTRKKNATHQPSLTGEDRKIIYRAVLRNGKAVKPRKAKDNSQALAAK
jgi:hypothetical protein